jgi:hypothetical protein
MDAMQNGWQQALNQISRERFAEFGIARFAYVKRAADGGETVYGVYAADGTYLWQFAEEDVARAALRQEELEPLSVH